MKVITPLKVFPADWESYAEALMAIWDSNDEVRERFCIVK